MLPWKYSDRLTNRMKFSRYLLKIPHDDKKIMLVGLRRRNIVVTERSAYERLRVSLEENTVIDQEYQTLFDELLDSRIIVDEKEDELTSVAIESMAARAISDTFSVIMVPTIGCNLRCNYCFQSHGAHAKAEAYIEDESLRRYLLPVLESGRFANLHLRWFGGEPLTAMQSIEKITAGMKVLCGSLGLRYSADVVTNGTLLTRSVAEKLFELHAKDIQVTFDGHRRVHNGVRRGPNFLETYDILLNNLEAAADLLRIRVRIHVAPYNFSGIKDLLLDLKTRDLQTRLKSIYFAPLFDYRQEGKSVAFQAAHQKFMSSEHFARSQVELHRMALEMGFSLPDPLDVDYGVCTALRENTVVVNSDGSLTKCYMDAGDPEEAFGHLSEEVHRPLKKSIWRDTNFAKDDDCRSCDFAPVCLGGCAKQGQHGADKSMICTPLKYNYRDLLRLHFSDQLLNSRI